MNRPASEHAMGFEFFKSAGWLPWDLVLKPMGKAHPSGETPSRPTAPSSRFLLWVDGVGGYLVCEAAEVTVGQPVPGHYVDIPILGDISRRHAKIRRDGEGYLLEPLRPVCVDGRPVDGRTLLVDGALIELGQGVQLRFRRPHRLSNTARLEFVSRHRTQPSADAVLLLADTCVLGQSAGCHVPCRQLKREVVLYKQGAELGCRTRGGFEIDGRPARDRGPITRSSQLLGDDFSLRLEAI